MVSPRCSPFGMRASRVLRTGIAATWMLVLVGAAGAMAPVPQGDLHLTRDPSALHAPLIVAAASGRVHLVWQDSERGAWETHYRYGDGADWSADLRLSEAAPAARYPSIAAGPDGEIELVWQEVGEGPPRVYFRLENACLDGRSFPACRTLERAGILFAPRFTTPLDSISRGSATASAYDSTRLTLSYDATDRFFISGSPDSLTGWVCAGKLTVDGREACAGSEGILDPALPLCRPVETILAPAPPCDISDWLPTGTRCVCFRLVSARGGVVGSSGIYLIRMAGSGTESDPGQEGGIRVRPNPVRKTATLEWTARSSGAYTLSIYTVGGRRLRSFPEVPLQAGRRHSWFWDGADQDGRQAGPGLYYCSVGAPGSGRASTILMLR